MIGMRIMENDHEDLLGYLEFQQSKDSIVTRLWYKTSHSPECVGAGTPPLASLLLSRGWLVLFL